MEEFNVFLSWSGPTSKAIAEAWRKYLPFIIQAAKPWMSSEDIPKGSTWFSDLTGQLKGIRIGIICITPDNLLSPSIHFEAGALSKTVSDTSFVCPYLFDVKDSDLKFPLANFQTTKARCDDTKRLALNLNKALQAGLTQEQVTTLFDKFWPDFEKDLKAIKPPGGKLLPSRDEKEILEEVLEIVRGLRRQTFTTPFSQTAFYGEAGEPGIFYKSVPLSSLMHPLTVPDLVVSGNIAPPDPVFSPGMEPKSTPTPIAEPPGAPPKKSK